MTLGSEKGDLNLMGVLAAIVGARTAPHSRPPERPPDRRGDARRLPPLCQPASPRAAIGCASRRLDENEVQ
jgi:hypothetical protein